ncbi:Multiprotein-bridging factor 1b [Abeliophyllum distichum]|uniref:Multiprotein-bridging factor 1b n=1 Tax=Abeliophyllum distichum TaxID=126358 RepID=A0ABD1RV22_9LAMI
MYWASRRACPKPTAADPRDEKAVNAALCSGAEIETLKKSNASTNRAASICTSLNTRKLDEDTENLTRKMINEKPQIIQEYESGKAIPNQQIISKLDRALGTKLRGKK